MALSLSSWIRCNVTSKHLPSRRRRRRKLVQGTRRRKRTVRPNLPLALARLVVEQRLALVLMLVLVLVLMLAAQPRQQGRPLMAVQRQQKPLALAVLLIQRRAQVETVHSSSCGGRHRGSFNEARRRLHVSAQLHIIHFISFGIVDESS